MIGILTRLGGYGRANLEGSEARESRRSEFRRRVFRSREKAMGSIGVETWYSQRRTGGYNVVCSVSRVVRTDELAELRPRKHNDRSEPWLATELLVRFGCRPRAYRIKKSDPFPVSSLMIYSSTRERTRETGQPDGRERKVDGKGRSSLSLPSCRLNNLWKKDNKPREQYITERHWNKRKEASVSFSSTEEET